MKPLLTISLILLFGIGAEKLYADTNSLLSLVADLEKKYHETTSFKCVYSFYSNSEVGEVEKISDYIDSRVGNVRRHSENVTKCTVNGVPVPKSREYNDGTNIYSICVDEKNATWFSRPTIKYMPPMSLSEQFYCNYRQNLSNYVVVSYSTNLAGQECVLIGEGNGSRTYRAGICKKTGILCSIASEDNTSKSLWELRNIQVNPIIPENQFSQSGKDKVITAKEFQADMEKAVNAELKRMKLDANTSKKNQNDATDSDNIVAALRNSTVSLSFDRVQVSDAVKMLTHITGEYNIKCTKSADSKSVSLDMANVPAWDVIKEICNQTNLKWRVDKGILLLYAQEEVFGITK